MPNCKCHNRPTREDGRCSIRRAPASFYDHGSPAAPSPTRMRLSPEIRAWLLGWAERRGVAGYNGKVTLEAAMQAIRQTLQAYGEG